MLNSVKKAEVVKEYQKAEGDTGSTEVQVALISTRIRELQDHFTKHKKDVHSRLGLTKLVSQRRRLLKYLKAKNQDAYRKLIERLGIRG